MRAASAVECRGWAIGNSVEIIILRSICADYRWRAFGYYVLDLVAYAQLIHHDVISGYALQVELKLALSE